MEDVRKEANVPASDGVRERPFIALLCAVFAWALACVAPTLIWPLCLDNLAARPGNLLALGLVTAVGGSVGLLSRNHVQGLVLGVLTILVRPAPHLSYWTILIACVAARLGVEWRARRAVATVVAPVRVSATRLRRGAGALAGLLELGPVWKELALAATAGPAQPPPGEGTPVLRRFLVVFLLLFLVHEAGTRVLVGSSVEEVERDGDWFRPHPYLWHTYNPDRNHGLEANRYGYRKPGFDWPKAPGTRRVVVVGSSVVYCYGDPEKTMPAVLGQELSRRLPGEKVETINSGFHSNSSQLSLVHVATRVVELAPDVVVFYVGDCDLTRDVSPGASTDPDDRSVDYQRDDANRIAFKDTTPVARWLGHRCALLGNTFVRGGLIRPTTLENLFVNPGTDRPGALEEALVGDGPYNAVAVVGSAAAALGHPFVPPPWPPWRDHVLSQKPEDLARYHRGNLDKMIALARHAGAKTVVCSLVVKLTPTGRRFLPDEPWEVERARVTAMREAMNANIRDLASKTGSLYVELEGRVVPDERHFQDTIHWNYDGAAAVARAIADDLVASGWPAR